MWRFVFLLIGIFLPGQLGYTQVVNSDKRIIVWEKEYRLTKSDFQGFIPDKNRYGAMSYCSIEYSLCDTGYKIFAAFDMEQSWLAEFSSTLLTHEQGHFDICEIQARKARKYFYSLNKNEITQSEIIRIINSYNDSFISIGSKYDYETIHGLDSMQQDIWEKRIGEILNSMDQYE